MKKIILPSVFLLLLTFSACQKRAICTYPGTDEVVRFYEKDYPTNSAYNFVVAETELNGYICEEKSVSALSK